ncbi:hypothetical protein BDW_07475 [Bdellovibrio bacteriovorus W]|nr:hypothetical protein BDW_07475 [Bdellovibrio bacteriovorus W]
MFVGLSFDTTTPSVSIENQGLSLVKVRKLVSKARSFTDAAGLFDGISGRSFAKQF